MSENQNATQVAGYQITIPGTLSDRRLTIEGRLPGLNEYTKACRTSAATGAAMKRTAQNAVAWYILSQLRGCRFEKPVFILFTFYEKDRRRDRDNVASFARKVIQDALVEFGTLQDDGWDQVTGYMDRFHVDSKNPRIVVEFIEQEEETQCKRQPGKKSEK